MDLDTARRIVANAGAYDPKTFVEAYAMVQHHDIWIGGDEACATSAGQPVAADDEADDFIVDD